MSAQVTRTPRRAWGRIVLVALLGLSLLGNAMTAGVVWRFQQLRVAVLGDEMRVPAFPPEIRSALRHRLSADEALKTQLRETVEARREIVDISSERPLDRGATEAAMAEFRTRFITTLDEMQALVLGVLEEEAAGE
ncbi:hypothetical protein [Celeribacter neptunius]|uniref:Heavy-metal resistance n=1 Tax=Celeribacter neptunius TaxID=588602 RepID=A0A1I3WJB5_9RHOB|nr:hypothetical protein [Celeribacter neptunius]SFK06957.1 hypothetical protein SAMN04487991_3755 [Celeribacter neptunius]